MVERGGLGEQRVVELAADHGGGVEHRAARRGEAVEPQADHGLDRRGQRSPVRGPRGLAARCDPIAADVSPELAEKEGIALGLGDDGAHHRLRCVGIELREQRARIGWCQRAQCHLRQARRPAQIVEGGGQRLRLFAVAVRGGDEEAVVAQGARDAMQEEQRRAVGPLEVLERQHDRLARRGTAEKRRDRLDERDPRVLGIDHRRRGRAGVATQPRHDVTETARCGTDRRQHVAAIAADGVRRDDVLPRREGRRAVAARRDQGLDAARARRADQLFDEPRLADAGLAGDERDAAAAGQQVVERRRQPRRLGASPDQFSAPARRQCRLAARRRGGCRAGARRAHARFESSRSRLHELADAIEAGVDRRVGEFQIGPELILQLVARHDPIAVADQVQQDVELARLHRQLRHTVTTSSMRLVDDHVAEIVDQGHRPLRR